MSLGRQISKAEPAYPVKWQLYERKRAFVEDAEERNVLVARCVVTKTELVTEVTARNLTGAVCDRRRVSLVTRVTRQLEQIAVEV